MRSQQSIAFASAVQTTQKLKQHVPRSMRGFFRIRFFYHLCYWYILKLRLQVFHLVSQHFSIAQVKILVQVRSKRYREQFHARLFGCSIGLEVIAFFAAGNAILPGIFTTG